MDNATAGVSAKPRRFSMIIVMLFGAGALGLVPASAASAVPATITVCASGCDSITVQDAIDDATAGDTIQVLAGTYSGFTVNKPVKIVGPNHEIHPQDMSQDVLADNPDRLPGEAVINGMVTFGAGIDDITISGFKIVTPGDYAGVKATTSDNVTITYNDFSSGSQPIYKENGGPASTWVVSHNRIDDITGPSRTAMYLADITNLTVEDNFIRHDNTGVVGRRGVNLDGSNNVTLTGNNIDMGARGDDMSTGNGQWAIQLAMTLGAVDGVTIESNWIRGAKTGISGLSNNSLHNVVIRQNTIYDTLSSIVLDQGSSPPPSGFSPVIAGLEISGNDIAFLEHGVWLRSVADWLHHNGFKYSDVAISGNRFTLSQPTSTDSSCKDRYGVEECKPVSVYKETVIDGSNTGKINARGNWWGTGAGPSANQQEESQVDSGGWISAYEDDPAKEGQPGFWPLSKPAAPAPAPAVTQPTVIRNPTADSRATRPDPTTPTVVTDSTQPLVIEVASSAEGAGVDYSALLTGGTGTIPQTTFVTSNGVTVKIPQTRITSDDPSWDGVIQPPTVVPNSSVTIPAESGTTVTVGTAIQVGAGTIGLTFDEGVRLLLPGESGKLVGFERNGTFAPITAECSADTQTAGDALAAGGDCYISVGADIVIWTKHFTTFVAYSYVAAPAPAPAPAAPDATGPEAPGPALWVGGALLLVLVLGSALLVARRRKALAGVS